MITYRVASNPANDAMRSAGSPEPRLDALAVSSVGILVPKDETVRTRGVTNHHGAFGPDDVRDLACDSLRCGAGGDKADLLEHPLDSSILFEECIDILVPAITGASSLDVEGYNQVV